MAIGYFAFLFVFCRSLDGVPLSVAVVGCFGSIYIFGDHLVCLL